MLFGGCFFKSALVVAVIASPRWMGNFHVHCSFEMVFCLEIRPRDIGSKHEMKLYMSIEVLPYYVIHDSILEAMLTPSLRLLGSRCNF